MRYVFKLKDEEVTEYKEFIPEAYLNHYELGEPIVFYGLVYEDLICGIVVLELGGNEINVLYVNIMKEYITYFEEYISLLKYELCIIADRIIWEFIEDEVLAEILRKSGFVISKGEKAVFKFSISSFANATTLNTNYNSNSNNVISLGEIDNITIKKFFETIADAGKDLVETPRHGGEYIEECSVIYIENDVPTGILLIKGNQEEGLAIPYMYSASKNPMAIVEMMRFTLQQARKRYDKNIPCKTYIIEPKLVSIVERLVDVKGQFQYTGLCELNNIKTYWDTYKDIEF